MRAEVLSDDRVRKDDKSVESEDAAVYAGGVLRYRRIVDVRLTARYADRAAIAVRLVRRVIIEERIDRVEDAAVLINRAAVAIRRIAGYNRVEQRERAAVNDESAAALVCARRMTVRKLQTAHLDIRVAVDHKERSVRVSAVDRDIAVFRIAERVFVRRRYRNRRADDNRLKVRIEIDNPGIVERE